MNGKVCVVTGANAGIGRTTAEELARQGATVVMICRSRERGEEAQRAIQDATKNPNVELVLADLSSQQQVRRAAADILAKHKQIHVLVNNAAVFLPRREETEDAFEKTFATNYLSHFLLTMLLLDALEAGAPSRIVNVATTTMGLKAVGPTKRALILFTEKLMSTTPEKGARTSIYLATSPEVANVSGKLFANCKPIKAGGQAADPAVIDKMWNVSLQMTQLQA